MCDESRAIEIATQLVSEGAWSQAQQTLVTSLNLHPDCGRLWLLRGMAEFHLADYAQARRALEHAGLLVPLDGRMQCLLADCYARCGQIEQSRNLLSMLRDDPASDSAELLPLLAAGFGQTGDFENALATCRRAAELDPQDAAPHFGIAYYLRRLGYPAGMILPELTRAFELDPRHPVYRTSLALLLADDGRRDEAYDLLRELPVDRCQCACGLRRMKSLFQAVGDMTRWQQCARRLDEIRSTT